MAPVTRAFMVRCCLGLRASTIRFASRKWLAVTGRADPSSKTGRCGPVAPTAVGPGASDLAEQRGHRGPGRMLAARVEQKNGMKKEKNGRKVVPP